MGLFHKLFGLPTKCPACGHDGARESFSGTQCVSPECIHYDGAYAQEAVRGGIVHWSVLPPVTFDSPIDVEYVNAQDESKTFTADRTSFRVRGRHLSVRVAPSGRRIALLLDRSQNLDQRRPAIPSGDGTGGPTPREAYVINFHRRRGSTSPLYQSLCAKYPEFAE